MAAVVDSKICLRKFVAYLETYRGRDKIIRLLNYSLYIVSGLLKRASGSENALNAGKLAAELSNLRVMLRLLDDLAMLQFTLSYGTGSSSEKDPICRALQVIQNCFDQLYYPLEHIAWARDAGILKGNSNHLWSTGCFFWVISLSISILISLRKLMLLRKQKRSSSEEELLENESESNEKVSIDENSKKNTQIIIGLVGNLADLMNGINWLPSGILWASKLPEEAVGIFGVISTLCFIYNSVAST